jgi:hypothetical protein
MTVSENLTDVSRYGLQDSRNSVTDAIACLGFSVWFATKAVIGIAVKTLATFANLVLSVTDDFKPQFSFKTNDEVVVLEAVFLL